MGELELEEIEKRIDQYPPQAGADIVALVRELRRIYALAGHSKPAQPASPLYDAETGLLNSGAYGVRFAAARARATRYRKIFAVMSIDLNAVAADIGTEEREQTIKAVAGRLDSCVRATDTLARIGEGQFAIILEDLTQADDAERVKQTVQDALAAPMEIAGRDAVPATQVKLRFYPEIEKAGALH
jgi:diguanylate cyclase (GGDEF)-like protein